MHRITFDELDSYILAIDNTRNLDQILATLQKQISILGFEKLTYWLRWSSQDTKRPIFISTYPVNFINQYIDNNYQSYDMVGRLSTEKNTPFSWSEISQRFIVSDMQKVIFGDSSSVGLRSGGSIPIHGPNQIKATFSVANDMTQVEFDKLFNYHRHELHILGTYAHEKIISLGIDSPNRCRELSSREAEILTWVSRGKTYWEIGMILSIQEDTIKKHMRNIYQTLQVSNNTHAVAKAIIHGLIYP